MKFHLEPDRAERLDFVDDRGFNDPRLRLRGKDLFGSLPPRIGDPVGELALKHMDQSPCAVLCGVGAQEPGRNGRLREDRRAAVGLDFRRRGHGVFPLSSCAGWG